jgi:hypothetical protein
MSSISFMTRNEEVQLRGAERAHMGLLLNRLALSLLPDGMDAVDDICAVVHYHGEEEDWKRYNDAVMREDWYESGQLMRDIRERARLSLSTGFGCKISVPPTHYDGDDMSYKVDPFSIILNTCLVYGSDPIKLMAWLHGQCEIHLWIAGPNRAMIADIIESGLKLGIYRKGMNWEGVVKLLRQSKRGAVVTEFSVSDSFHWSKGLNPDMELTPLRLREGFFGKTLCTLDHCFDPTITGRPSWMNDEIDHRNRVRNDRDEQRRQARLAAQEANK